jgi:proline iminopeptidase
LGYEKVYLELFPATGHGGAAFITEGNLTNIFSFIDKYLRYNNQSAKLTDPIQKINQPEERFIEVDGSKLRYVVEGEGVPCLIIGSSVYYPKTFSEDLRKHLKMYFVDMKWFAKDYVPENLDTVNKTTIIEDVEQIRKNLGLEKPVIMGHSIHGTIAMEYAKKYSDNLSGVVLIGSPCEWGNSAYDQKAAALWETASEERKMLQEQNWGKMKEIDRLKGKEEAAAMYNIMSPQYWYDPRYDAGWLWEGMTVHSEVTTHLFANVFNDYNMFNPAVSIPIPVFVGLGKYDYVIPHTLWQPAYETIPDFTFTLFEKSAHTPQLEENLLFDQAMIRWINSKIR